MKIIMLAIIWNNCSESKKQNGFLGKPLYSGQEEMVAWSELMNLR